MSVLDEIGNEEDKWGKKLLTIAKHFDVMWWWHKCGRQNYPRVHIVACAVLAVPESNGDQERTFSACTWFDGKLQRNQTLATFEMKALLYKNKKLILDMERQLRQHSETSYKKEAERITKKMLKEAAERNKRVEAEEDVEKREIIVDLLSGEEEENELRQLMVEGDEEVLAIVSDEDSV